MENESPVIRFVKFLVKSVDNHLTWFRETIALPNNKEYYWYHQKINRVPTVDECYEDDFLCQYEANIQFISDRKVDNYIIKILKKRYQFCVRDYPYDYKEVCQHLYVNWQNAIVNFHIKYGDLGRGEAVACYMKQKHRMAWERRHGPVGSGKKPEELYGRPKPTCEN
ncbi:hypothetical protein RUM43_004464 [Polyplax serrata]|uniref:NADH dehydrogenase [ubiquinone] 1 beta subcomplex subunit 10 n=1 Tax=Polyplax serrata TaxID=468196 RepID=A0AAN8SB01_POLSC